MVRRTGRSATELDFIINANAEFLDDAHVSVNTISVKVNCWRWPPEDVLKINIDGSFHPITGEGG